MRKMVGVLLVALLVLVAGCAGDGGTDGAATTTATSGDVTTAGDATGSTGGSSGESAGGSATTDGFTFNGTWDQQFRTGQYYRYEITSEDFDGVATYEWEVLSASEDEVTVRAKVDTPDFTNEQTVTAPPDEVYSQFGGSPSGAFVFIGFASPYYSGLDGETLAVGDGWEYSGPNGNASYRVERVSTFAGLQCADFVVRTNGSVVWESCVAPDSPLPGYVAFYDEGVDQPVFEMTLVEYRPGN